MHRRGRRKRGRHRAEPAPLSVWIELLIVLSIIAAMIAATILLTIYVIGPWGLRQIMK